MTEEQRLRRNKYMREYQSRPERRDKKRALDKAWHEKNPGARASYAKQWRKEHPKEVRNAWASWRDRNPLKALLVKVKARAKRAGVPFSLTESDLEFPEVCPVLGIRIDYQDFSSPGYPNFDRVVPLLGYVPGNVKVISAKANKLKSDGTADDHERIAAYIRKFGNME